MNFPPADWKSSLLLAGALLTMALPAGAQSTNQPLIFSSPEGGDSSLNPIGLSSSPELPASFQGAPSALKFGGTLPAAGVSPPNVPTVFVPDSQELRNSLDERRNWALMTPGEILGVATPEKILRIPERDAMGLPKNQTVMERYMERQGPSAFTTTNGLASGDSVLTWRFAGNSDGFESETDAPNPVSSSLISPPQTLNRLFQNSPGDDFFGGNGEAADNNSGWSKIFAPPTAVPVDSAPQQQTPVDQFKQWFGNNLPAATPNVSADNAVSSSSSSQNYNFGQPAVNPVGASFAPLTSGITAPAGLPPLPSITGGNLQPAVTPAWAPQAPPWMSQGPQPFVIPQRKF